MKNEITSRFRGGLRCHWLVLMVVLGVGLPRAALPQAPDGPQSGSVRQANLESLVFIIVKARRANGLEDPFTGTGFIVHPDGYVLTCSHVVPSEGTTYAKVECTGAVGARHAYAYPLTIVDRNEQRDLMLLKLPESGKGPWHSLERSALAQVDSRIVALGFPLDEDLVEAPGSITGNEGHGRWFTNAGLTFGMSGGPVFDEAGAVVGVVTGGYPEARILDLIIPLSVATGLLQEVGSPLLPIPTPTAIPAPTPTPLTPTPLTPTQRSDLSYGLTTTTDPVQPGKMAQFTITVTNLTDSRAFSEFAFHVPKFTTYNGYPEGTASSVVLGWIAAGASVSANLDFKVLGGNQSPPDGSVVTLVLTDLNRGASISHSVTVMAAPVGTLDLSTQQGTVAPGKTFSYFLTYHNASGDALSGTKLSVVIPGGTSFVSTNGGGILGTDKAVRWPLGTLAPGATGQVQLNLKASSANSNYPALVVEAALRGGNNLLAQASDFKAVYVSPTFSYGLTTTTDPAQPGKTAQFTVSVTNLTDSRAFSEFAFHVPKFTTYNGYPEGTASSVVLGWIAAGASVSANLDFKVLGGNQSPPDGSVVTLVLTDLNCGASVSHSVGINKAITMLNQQKSSK